VNFNQSKTWGFLTLIVLTVISIVKFFSTETLLSVPNKLNGIVKHYFPNDLFQSSPISIFCLFLFVLTIVFLTSVYLVANKDKNQWNKTIIIFLVFLFTTLIVNSIYLKKYFLTIPWLSVIIFLYYISVVIKPDSAIRENDIKSDIFPKILKDKEEELIKLRRSRANITNSQSIGMAISGGGIRSATFGLGIIQALSKLNILTKIDILSTVSGGGYIGGFLTSLFIEREEDEKNINTPTNFSDYSQNAEYKKDIGLKLIKDLDIDSRISKWLRINSRYLTPSGSGDFISFSTMIIRNWLALMLFIILVFTTIFYFIGFVSSIIPDNFFGNFLFPIKIDSFFRGNFLSPLLILFAVLIFIPTGVSYWLFYGKLIPNPFREVTKSIFGPSTDQTINSKYHNWGNSLIYLLILISIFIGLALQFPEIALVKGFLSKFGPNPIYFFRIVLFCSLSTILIYFFERRFNRYIYRKLIINEDYLLGPRHRLSRRLGKQLVFFLCAIIILIFVNIDYNNAVKDIHKYFGLAFIFFIPIFGNPFVVSQSLKKPIKSIDLFFKTIIAFFLLSSILFLSAFLANGFLQHWKISAINIDKNLSSNLLFLMGLLIITIILGKSFFLVNLTSHNSYFMSMITRAYLGASNRIRSTKLKYRNYSLPVTGDDIPMALYAPYEHGGPLHIINCTLNETIGKISAVIQRDRKGMNFAFGPVGISVGSRHHALLKIERKLKNYDNPESESALEPISNPDNYFNKLQRIERNPDKYKVNILSLGSWLSISGAAVSSGMGRFSNVINSIVFTLLNIRLGYWWDSKSQEESINSGKINIILKRIFLVPYLLFQELTSIFWGTASRFWHLSDGGHFENTGAYELIRRRTKIILLLENGHDEHYKYCDLAKLVRIVRIDFGAEIEFLKTGSLYCKILNGIELIDPSNMDNRKDHKFLGIAIVKYPKDINGDQEYSLIVIVKPAIIDDMPSDIVEYQKECKDKKKVFPQEPTLDQFFSESQWESYRKLGELIGEKVFFKKFTTFERILKTYCTDN
jgi:hypothetical protein